MRNLSENSEVSGQGTAAGRTEICKGVIRIGKAVADADKWKGQISFLNKERAEWTARRDDIRVEMTVVRNTQESSWSLKAPWLDDAFWMTASEREYIITAAAPLIEKIKQMKLEF
jgi:hypothetical protein